MNPTNKFFFKTLQWCLVFLSITVILSCGGGSDNLSDAENTDDDDDVDAEESFSVSTPQNFTDILSNTIALSPTTKSTINDYDRILLRHNGSYLRVTDEFAIENGASLTTFGDLVANSFLLVPEAGSDCHRLDSEKHGLYSVDYQSATSELIMSNAWGIERDASSAYLCFTFDFTSNKITATERYRFNTTSKEFEEDLSFSPMEIEYNNVAGQFELSATGTAFLIQDSGFDFSIPSDFNPDQSALVSNARAVWDPASTKSYSESNLTTDKLYKDSHDDYQPQLTSAGYDASTTAAAESMLEQIEATLTSENASLRYPKEVYLAFREAMLKTTLGGANIVNGEIGQNTAPWVFFTNEEDDVGTPHPFMVIGTYSISDKPNHLLEVTVPPGDGGTPDYNTQTVTRDALLQTYLIKIPLKDYGLVTNFTDNTMDNTLADDVGETDYSIYNYASVNYIAVAIDGVMIYPVLNNTLASAQKKAEVTNTGIHVGRGMGLHWHSDGHSGNGNGLNLYNLADYENASHPPLIGFGMDGLALYGKYEISYNDMAGYSLALDDFGGHEHGDYGYHYHAHTAPSTIIEDQTDYTLHILMNGAWRGDINDIPEFWAQASQANRYVGSASDISR